MISAQFTLAFIQPDCFESFYKHFGYNYLINTDRNYMARLTIDTGTAGNPATGDSLRGAFTKVNANFEEIFSLIGDGSTGLITSSVTNGDLKIQPNGTGVIEIDQLQIDSDSITSIVTNGTVNITGNGTGGVGIEDIQFNGTSLSSSSSSTINLNENVNLDGDLTVTGDVLPATDNTQYLGSASKRWHTVYVGPGSINLGGAVISNTGGVVALPGVNTVGYRPSSLDDGAGGSITYPLVADGSALTFTDVPVIIDQVTYGLATGQIVLAPGVSYTRATYTATMSNPGVDGTVDNITITDAGSIYPTNENFQGINTDNMWALPAGTDLTDLSAINTAIGSAVRPYGVIGAGVVSSAEAVVSGYISLSTLKSVVAASTSFADFQSRIAAL